MVWWSNPQFFKKDIIEGGIVILSCVYEHMLAVTVKERNYPA
jgi:hypothetical protein